MAAYSREIQQRPREADKMERQRAAVRERASFELERLNVVDRSRLGHGPATYHLASAAHSHLVCEQCNSITEVPGDIFTDLTETARTRYGFTVQPHRFAVIGLCSNCQ